MDCTKIVCEDMNWLKMWFMVSFYEHGDELLGSLRAGDIS
jgi:hypothetical protein